jgi:hypothetical protein
MKRTTVDLSADDSREVRKRAAVCCWSLYSLWLLWGRTGWGIGGIGYMVINTGGTLGANRFEMVPHVLRNVGLAALHAAVAYHPR